MSLMLVPLRIARFEMTDAAALHALRLEALAAHPDVFGASLSEESAGLPAWLAAHLDAGEVFGAWDGADLAGMAGLWRETAEKRRHRGGLWGMYVRPAWRGRGVGAALVRHVLERAAAAGLEQVHLAVAVDNAAARALYDSMGFLACGIEPRALKIGQIYVDELLMVRRLNS